MGAARVHSASCHSICQAILTGIFPLCRVFKTPGLRTPAARERIYNISMNGSPLADSKEIFLTVPVGGGEVSVSEGCQATTLLAQPFCPGPITHFSPPQSVGWHGCRSPHLCRTQNPVFSPRLEAQAGILARLHVPICSSANICPAALWQAQGVDDTIPALEKLFSSQDRFTVKNRIM